MMMEMMLMGCFGVFVSCTHRLGQSQTQGNRQKESWMKAGQQLGRFSRVHRLRGGFHGLWHGERCCEDFQMCDHRLAGLVERPLSDAWATKSRVRLLGGSLSSYWTEIFWERVSQTSDAVPL